MKPASAKPTGSPRWLQLASHADFSTWPFSFSQRMDLSLLECFVLVLLFNLDPAGLLLENVCTLLKSRGRLIICVLTRSSWQVAGYSLVCASVRMEIGMHGASGCVRAIPVARSEVQTWGCSALFLA